MRGVQVSGGVRRRCGCGEGDTGCTVCGVCRRCAEMYAAPPPAARADSDEEANVRADVPDLADDAGTPSLPAARENEPHDTIDLPTLSSSRYRFLFDGLEI